MAVRDRRDVWLKMLLSASLVASLVPAPALAEVVGDTPLAEDELAAAEATADEPAATTEDGKAEAEDAATADDALSQEDAAAPAPAADEPEQAAEPVADKAAEAPAEAAEAPAEATEAQEAAAAQAPAEPTLTTASEPTAEPMELDTPVRVSFDEGEYWLGSFTAPADNIYLFESSGNEGDPYGYLYADEDMTDELKHSDDDGEGSNFKMSIELSEGETVYLKAQGYDLEAASYDVCVSAVDRYDLTAATYGFDTDRYPSGSPVEVALTVRDTLGDKLTEGVDFELVFSYEKYDEEEDAYVWVPLEAAPSEAGRYRVGLRECAGSAYHGEIEDLGTITLTPANDLNGARIEWNDSSTFELPGGGQPVDLSSALRVIAVDGTVLAQGTHYELVYYRWDDETGEYGETPAPTEAGDYCVAARAIEGGGYENETGNYTFNVINPYDLYLSRYHLSFWPSSEVAYTGSAVSLPQPVLYVTDDDAYYYDDYEVATLLKEGTDYELARVEDDEGNQIDAPSEPGQYYAVYRGINNYSGERTRSFTIVEAAEAGTPLSDVNATLSDTAFVATGAAIKPEVRMVDENGSQEKLLVEGTDFKFVRYEDADGNVVSAPTKPGSYQAIYQGIGEYCGERWLSFAIYAESDLATASLALADYHLGVEEGVTPELKAFVHDRAGTLLKRGTDYELVYFDGSDEEDSSELPGMPTEWGLYYVAARGKGDYTGETARTSFNISRRGADDTHEQAGGDAMALDTTYSVSFGSNQYWLGTFTAPADGHYVFESTGNYDTYGELYADAELTNEVAHNDDSGASNNFKVAHKLTKDETVYLRARQYSWERANFKVSVTKVNEKNLALGYLEIDRYTYVSSGGKVDIVPTLTDYEGNKLTLGTDYELAYYQENGDGNYERLTAAPSEVGHYYVSAVAKGSTYTGESGMQSFRVVDGNDLSYASIDIGDDDSEVLYGQNVTAAVTVKDAGGSTLVAGTSYTLEFAESRYGIYAKMSGVPSAVGSYRVRAVAKGSTYTGQTGWHSLYIVDPHDLASNGRIDLSGYAYYRGYPVYRISGSSVEPEVTVTVPGGNDTHVTLTNGTDYTISYSNNKGATTYGKLASVTITGKGAYKGSLTAYFIITGKLDIAARAATGVRLSYNGGTTWAYASSWVHGEGPSYLMDEAGVKPTVVFLGEDALPVAGTDYDLLYVNDDEQETTPKTAGVYAVLVKAKGNAYEGSTLVPFTLVETKPLGYSLSLGMDYDGFAERRSYLSWNVYGFGGSLAELANQVAVTLYDGGRALVANLDYAVDVVTDVATDFFNFVFRTGSNGRYTGSVSVSVYNKTMSLESAQVTVRNASYSGKAVKPTVSVSVYGPTVSGAVYNAGVTRTLKAGTDYKLTYKNNKNVGTATVTVTGTGGFTGSVSKTFKVTQAANTAKAAKTSVKKTVKAAAVKKKAQTVALPKVTAKFGKAAWKVATKDKKKVLSLKGGKVVVKKGAKKGTYTIKLKASVKATKNYKAATTKTVTVKVVVKK